MTRREAGAAAGLALALVAVPLAAAVATGAIDAAHQDDWAYYRATVSLLDSGELRFVNWNAMTLVGHMLWGAPFLAAFGHSIAAAQAAGAVASVIALLAAHRLYRRFLPFGLSVFGLAAAGTVPLFMLVATSYMTDVTALAAQLVCLALGLAALEARLPGRRWLLGAALLVGFLGFASREVALAAPLAVLAGYALAARSRNESIRGVAFAAGGFLAACAVFYAWRSGLAGADTRPLRVPGPDTSLKAVAALYFALALCLLPPLAFAARGLLAPLRSRAGAVIVAVVAGLGVLKLAGADPDLGVFPGNYITRRGVNSGLFGAGPPVFPELVWWAVMGLAVISAVALAAFLHTYGSDAARVFRRAGVAAFEPKTWTLGLFAVMSAGVLVLLIVTSDAWVFDRYVLPLAVLLPLPILKWAERNAGLRAARLRGALGLALSACLALVLLLEMKPAEGARWNAGERLVAAGFSPRQVDAGFEWVGFRYGTRMVSRGAPVWRSPAPGYMRLFPRSSNCALLSQTRRLEPWLEPLGVERYRTLLGLRERQLWLYRNTRACAADR